jgi:SAM-dependent methyltransferase
MVASLPAPDLLKMQSDWLADARARILRNAEIAKRKRVLDLGSGYGFVIPELKRRSGGTVYALDQSLEALTFFVANTPLLCGNAAELPVKDRSIDLVFSQNVLLWTKNLESVAKQVYRVLAPNGSWVLIEPDYGGLIEYPLEMETREIWIQALSRAGGDPLIGRKLPPLLTRSGYMIRVELMPRLFFPNKNRFGFLKELPLTDAEKNALHEIQAMSDEINPLQQVAHLPYFLIIADKAQRL